MGHLLSGHGARACPTTEPLRGTGTWARARVTKSSVESRDEEDRVPLVRTLVAVSALAGAHGG
jgi:hypothetical protein